MLTRLCSGCRTCRPFERSQFYRQPRRRLHRGEGYHNQSAGAPETVDFRVHTFRTARKMCHTDWRRVITD